MSISLQDAARELQIDPKTLSRWVKREQIEITDDPTDRRRRVIGWEQFERLREQRHPSARSVDPYESAPARAPSPAGAQSPTESLAARVAALETANTSLSALIAQQSYSFALLIQRTTAAEETCRLLAARLGGADQAENAAQGEITRPGATSSFFAAGPVTMPPSGPWPGSSTAPSTPERNHTQPTSSGARNGR